LRVVQGYGERRTAAAKVYDVKKTPPGTRSPNLADAACIAFSPASEAARIQIRATLGAEPYQGSLAIKWPPAR
jgi:hypothetical protein